MPLKSKSLETPGHSWQLKAKITENVILSSVEFTVRTSLITNNNIAIYLDTFKLLVYDVT